jgi:endonuclease YncB( thermonuclease family)
MAKKLTAKYLEKRKIPKVLIAGLILASVLGWTGWKNLDKIKNYYQIRQIFPSKTKMVEVIDGDTFTIKNGMTVRLLGIDAPNRGVSGYDEAKNYLSSLILNRSLTFEYDKYQDDKYGRILTYVWIDCFSEIKAYCRDDRALINEIMIRKGLAKPVVYSDRAKLKYQDDFLSITPQP